MSHGGTGITWCSGTQHACRPFANKSESVLQIHKLQTPCTWRCEADISLSWRMQIVLGPHPFKATRAYALGLVPCPNQKIATRRNVHLVDQG